MASIYVDGLDRLQLDLKQIIELPKSTKEEMLTSGAKILIEAQKKSAKSAGVFDAAQKYSSAHVADSPKQSKTYHGKDGASTYVYPQGNKRRANTTTRQAEVAFINEFGKSGQPARQFIRMANENSAAQIESAEFKVYDEFLSKKNL